MVFYFTSPSEQVVDARVLLPVLTDVFDALELEAVVKQRNHRAQEGILVNDIVLDVVSVPGFERLWRAQAVSKVTSMPKGYADFGFRKAIVCTASAVQAVTVACHELGHLLKQECKECRRDEEGIAYAFMFACAREIERYDIAGLGCVVMEEAHRSPSVQEWPVHYDAHRFVASAVRHGADTLRLYRDLVLGNCRVLSK